MSFTACTIILMVHVHCLAQASATQHKRIHVYGRVGEDVTLYCQDNSHVGSSKWQGPPSFSFYTYGTDISTSIQNYDKLSLVGDSSRGEYNLHIRNYTIDFEGDYRCITFIDNVPLITSYVLVTAERPAVVKARTRPICYTSLKRLAKVSINVKSYQIPIVLWSDSSGGKLGIWSVKTTSERDIFRLESYIIPLEFKHFGPYSLRVRNDAGSLGITLRLHDKGPSRFAETKVTPQDHMCNMSSEIRFRCIVQNVNDSGHGIFWYHYYKKTLLRILSATPDGTRNGYLLTIPKCHHEDMGQYRCSGNNIDLHRSGCASVSFKGLPIITKSAYAYKRPYIILRVLFYADPSITSNVWYYNDNEKEYITQESSHVFQVNETNVIVTTQMYQKQIYVNGFQVQLKVDISKFPSKGKFICHLRNDFGATETSFDVKNYRVNMNSVSNNDTMHTPHVNVTEIYNEPCGRNDVGNKRIAFYMYAALGLVVTLVCVTIVLTVFKFCSKTYRINKEHNRKDLQAQRSSCIETNRFRPGMVSNVSEVQDHKKQLTTVPVFVHEEDYSAIDDSILSSSSSIKHSDVGSRYETIEYEYEGLQQSNLEPWPIEMNSYTAIGNDEVYSTKYATSMIKSSSAPIQTCYMAKTNCNSDVLFASRNNAIKYKGSRNRKTI